MINKSIFIILLFFLSQIHSQNICIDFEIVSNNANDEKIYSELISNLGAKLKNSTFRLFVDDNKSFFNLKNGDSNSYSDKEAILLMADMLDYKCYSFLNSDYSLYEKTDYKIKNYTRTNWIISNDSKTIQGYNCFKATCILEKYDGKNFYSTYPVEAWFTNDIKKAFGPNGFGNLPGMILELKQAVVTFRATKIEECNEKIIDSNKEIISISDFYNRLKIEK